GPPQFFRASFYPCTNLNNNIYQVASNSGTDLLSKVLRERNGQEDRHQPLSLWLLFSDKRDCSPTQRSTRRKRLKPLTHLLIALDKHLQSSCKQRAKALKKSRRHIQRDHW
ncbi:unnamed protein product, partial [Ectocarpus sp. 4 AP-2014]